MNGRYGSEVTLKITGNPTDAKMLTEPDAPTTTQLSIVSSSGFRGSVATDISSRNDLPPPGTLYDFLVLSPNMSETDDAVELLRKASEMTKFGILTSAFAPESDGMPLNNSSPHVEKIDVLETLGPRGCDSRYGVVRKMIQQGGFDILAETVANIPVRPEGNTIDNTGERVVWGPVAAIEEAYTALLKSKNAQVMSPEAVKAVHAVLAEEFGVDRLVATAVFGSATRSANKKNSDYDYTVIVEGLSEDVHKREDACPRIKKRLREAGVNELCAFNLYTPEEFQRANDRRCWLIETMKTGYRVLYDRNDFMRGILDAKHVGVERVGNFFAWKGVEYVDASRFKHVVARHLEAAGLLQDTDSELADCHIREAQRVALISRLNDHGEATSRGSLLSLAQRLNSEYDEPLDLAALQRAELDQETQGKSALFGYDTIDRHLKAAEVLEEHGMPLESLWHTATALRNLYLNALHSTGNYITEGEITQLFLREFTQELSPELADKIYKDSFKAEQVLGRSDFLSFDLDHEGRPIYENPATSELNYAMLASSLRDIIFELRSNDEIIVRPNQFKPQVTIVISASNGPEQLGRCLSSLNSLIVPDGMVDVVVVGNVADKKPELDRPQPDVGVPTKLARQGQIIDMDAIDTDYVALITDDVIVTPLWLINLLSGFKNDAIACVSASSIPNPTREHPVFDDQEARTPTKNIMGEVLNILAGSACFRVDALRTMGDFNIEKALMDSGLYTAHKLRDAGYSLGHVKGGVTYFG